MDTAANAVLSPYLKRGWRGDAQTVERLLLRLANKDDIDQTIREHLARGNKIEAIKYYRTATGLGLKESKDYVDNLQ